MSTHWMAANQQGRSLAGPLLINCGKSPQLSLSAASDAKETDVPMAPKTYPIDTTNKPGTFTAMGADFTGAESGELAITAWDKKHLAGTFKLVAKGKTYAGSFDLKCPYGGNGVCE
jgi:hypothetical protein